MNIVQKHVQQAIDDLVADGSERGLQVAVYRHGELLVDAVAGVADPATGRAVESETVFHCFSTVKGAASAVVHVLAERGLIDYDTRIVDLWPEFGAHGKAAATVRHALTHSVGVPGIPAETTVDDLCDWDKMCAVIADAEPWWEPGTATGYHSYTAGYLLGEIVRRATGRRISEALRDEVAGPLGVADELYFGMPVSEHGRLAPLEDAAGAAAARAEMAQFSPDLPMMKAGPMATVPTAEMGNRTDVLAADIPACGKTSARAIARMYAALLGDVDGVRLISAERLREVTAVAVSGTDQVFGNPVRWCLGYPIGLPGGSVADNPGVFGMGGAGGSFAYADADTGIAFALTKNRMTSGFGVAVGISDIVRHAGLD